ncbi:probable NAD(P)H dehydrogenase (quinone) FQR1-like 2 [Phalaenopsis equestris]|uniref:probable NAD(P)H dehydrogenase (quinone) FQR1-like 2 n=1 Tax=Phalaenopsis equestris TaxID=78828 RepID=UPI0009E3A385|nr:probable NAD(P)H dehydrogenase (quinone) FQR1-like 2 [Phalaenopsis equestris]
MWYGMAVTTLRGAFHGPNNNEVVRDLDMGSWNSSWTAITQLAHHGMLFVPIGYTFGADMFTVEEIRGGSPYGAGVFAGGDGGRSATEAELQLAEHQGKYMASIVKKIAQSSPKQ